MADYYFKINYFNTSFFTKKIIGTMIKNKNGSIINISSISGVTGNAGRSAYSASKAAIISETKVLSKELGFYNIKVNLALQSSDIISYFK